MLLQTKIKYGSGFTGNCIQTNDENVVDMSMSNLLLSYLRIYGMCSFISNFKLRIVWLIKEMSL